MDEAEYYRKSLEVAKNLLELERRRFALENTFLRKHGVAIGTAVFTAVVGYIGTALHSNADATRQSARVDAGTQVSIQQMTGPRMLNQVGTVGRTESTIFCGARKPVTLLEGGSLTVALTGTTLRNGTAHLQFATDATKVNKDIASGTAEVVEVAGRKLTMAILGVTECSADYQIQRFEQDRP